MSPTRRTAPAWQQAIAQHATWQHWTAALDVQWRPDGVVLTGIPARWGPEITAPSFHSQDRALPPPRLRLWNLVRLCLRRTHHVSLVETPDKSTLHIRIKEK